MNCEITHIRGYQFPWLDESSLVHGFVFLYLEKNNNIEILHFVGYCISCNPQVTDTLYHIRLHGVHRQSPRLRGI